MASNRLVVDHNAGLFSCCTIALEKLMMYYNYHGFLPDEFNRAHQFVHYKKHPEENLIPMLFEDDCGIPLEARHYFMTNDTREQQFSDYRQLRFSDLNAFARRWFHPSQMVQNRIADFKSKYNIVPERTIAVFHRANDKVKETTIASDDEWLDMISKEVYRNPLRHLYVVPDNTEFAKKCRQCFDNVIIIGENHLYPSDPGACNFMKVPLEERPEHAINFFASVYIASQCQTLILSSGNGGFWAAVYRGHANNLHQHLNGQWLH